VAGPAAARLRIPESVEARLLAVQPRVREIAPHAHEWGLLKRVLNFREVIVERRLPLTRELAFWTIEADDDLEDFLFQNLLAAMPPHELHGQWQGLPAGYRPLLHVLEFERHRQFEGWTAVTNHGVDGMKAIVRGYRELGLEAEAKALAAAAKAGGDDAAWQHLDGDEDPCPRMEAIERAYAQWHDRTDDADIPVAPILAYVRANPGKFGVAG
jgi:hypothetical protein